MARLFIGKLNDTPPRYAIRLAKPGYNAADPDLSTKLLQYDSDWTVSGTVLAAAHLATNNKVFDFVPDLNYIPFVKVTSVHVDKKNREVVQILRAPQGQDRVTITRGQVSVISGDKLVLVLRAVAANASSGAQPKHPSRMLLGKGGPNVGGRFGTYISRPGFDVVDCGEGDLLFSTERRQVGISRVITLKSELLAGEAGMYSDATRTFAPYPYVPLFFANLNQRDPNVMYLPENKQLFSGSIIGSEITGALRMTPKSCTLFQVTNNMAVQKTLECQVCIFNWKFPGT